MAILLSLSYLPAQAQTGPAAPVGAQIAEQRATRAMDKARANSLELHAFLENMPKGGDLHNHVDGSIYAETFIREGAEDNLCVTLAGLAFTKPQTISGGQAVCNDGQVPVAQAFADQQLFDALVDALSMRGFVPSRGVTGHDHFFDTFEKFAAVDSRHRGEWLDEVATRAAAQNEQYLELMTTP